MLKILYEAESGDDSVLPLTIANALVYNHVSDLDDLEEIAEHLLAHIKNRRKQEAIKNETN